MKIYKKMKFSKIIVIHCEICDEVISLKEMNGDKLNLEQRSIRYFIEPGCGNIENDEYETEVGVVFKRERHYYQSEMY